MSRVRTLIKLSLILLIIQSASCRYKPKKRPNKETMCSDEECKARGKEYENNMDIDADPCEDFYSFTCGNWYKTHPGPRFDSEWTLIDEMNWKFVSIIKDVLEKYPTPSILDRMAKQAKKVYQTCLRIPEYPLTNAKTVKQEILDIGIFPAVPLWEMHNKYFNVSGESAFFAIKVIASTPSEEIPVIMLTEPTSAYGAIWHGKNWKPQERKNYLDYLLLIMKNLDLKIPEKVLKERIESVFEFRKKLMRLIEESWDLTPDRFGPFTREELKDWFNHSSRAMTDTQRIPWSEVIDTVLGSLDPGTKPEQRVVAIRRKQYFLDLMDLIKDVHKGVLANHIGIYFVERHMDWNGQMMKLLTRTSIEPHDRLSYIRERHYQRWQLCVEDHNMPETIESMIYGSERPWFPKESIADVQEMIDKIKAAMDDQMRHSSWMDHETRTKTMRKLNGLEQWIGFPKWYYERGIPRERSTKGILSPNASLNNVKNLLYIHAAIMLSPVFHPKIPALYNYAGLGATIGHELYHTMNDCGSFPSDKGDVVWWTHGMRKLCSPKMNEFIPVYNRVTDREFKKRYGETLQSDTTISVSENFPDVMGLEAAYNAYKQLAIRNPKVCEVLPGFKDYSCDEMFFIAFGNTFCGTYTTKAAFKKLNRSVHSIDSVRINGAVAQIDSFGRAFDCPIGSPMRPERKVNLLR